MRAGMSCSCPARTRPRASLPVVEQQGMFIAYASAPGRTACDRGDKSGPYAAALAVELSKAGVDHLSLFQNVKEAVYAVTTHKFHCSCLAW